MKHEIESALTVSNSACADRNVCALLTPAGRGAVAVVVVLGPLAEKKLDDFFCSASGVKLVENRQRLVFYGRWTPTNEDVVVVRSPAGAIEINCHGGLSAPASIMGALQASGFEVLDQLELVQSLKPGRWRAELVLAMMQAVTDKTAGILLQQYSLLEDLFTEIEQLIFGSPDNASEKLFEMVAWADFGRHLTLPWTVVFSGNPNVGKSSLMNSIVGFDRAIVHEIAGTTRDVVSHVTAVAGWPIEIKDTAGLGSSENSIEKMGIDIARSVIQDADLLVVVLDVSQERNEIDTQLLQMNPAVVVANKLDLAKEWSAESCCPGAIETSAKSGQGIQMLMDSIANKLVEELPPPDLLIPINPRQVGLLKTVSELIADNQIAEALDVWRQSV
jgi:tRNA modification GTPase